ncbi:type VI secretion system Vgr family protein [Acidocella sp.]|uniref:type VI secretion system Vgr family protein n=1 Tax=Acidocella sp. TaxID=50710 RepID=UPI003CFEC5B8
MSGELDILTITTPLPETSFGIAAMNGTEQISRPFQYNIQLHSGTALLDPNSLLDKAITVTICSPEEGETKRYVSGIVNAVRQLPSQSTMLWHYEISLVPKLWFLKQTQDCRFYQKQSALQIIKTILEKFNVTFSDKTSGSFPARDYVVQFNESYLHFIQRLMEDAGIFYFFTHAEGTHTMVLANTNTAFQDITQPQIYLDETNSGFGVLNSWHRTDRTALGSVRTDDYNPATDQLQPGAVSGTETTVLKASAASQRTHYAWPAVRDATGNAKTLATTHMLAAEVAAELYTGSGQIADFVAGGKFMLMNDPTTGSGMEYVIQSLSYHITNSRAGSSHGHRAAIASGIVAFPSKTTYQEEPFFLPPVMAGMYSAIVIGPDGEEIYTDDLGRIQVKFPFDHEGDITTDKTLWVRVMQGWSGNNWGTQYIPRIGMEVVVAFLEADVNRPVVVGCLFNGNNKPVFAADEKNKSGLRTRSTMQGGTANFSEFSIDDTKGSEAVYLHAEKDLNIEVENNRNVTVTKDETVQIDGKKTDTVKQDYATTVSEGNKTTTVSQGNESLDVTEGTITHTAGQSITLKVGGNSIKIDTSSITLTVGESTVKLTASEVDVTSMQVNVTGQTQTAVKGAIVQVTGDGMLELKGAMTMINS